MPITGKPIATIGAQIRVHTHQTKREDGREPGIDVRHLTFTLSGRLMSYQPARLTDDHPETM